MASGGIDLPLAFKSAPGETWTAPDADGNDTGSVCDGFPITASSSGTLLAAVAEATSPITKLGTKESLIIAIARRSILL